MVESESPLVTFVLFAYNQKSFIAEAVKGALSQTYSPLQIILSDDASTDGTYEVMREMVSKYEGPHEITLNKNPVNLGIGRHVNKIMEMVKGKFIVGAAGDDISDSNRVDTVLDIFLNSDETIYSLWSDARYIDAAGLPIPRKTHFNMVEVTDKTIVRNKTTLVGATHAWRREVFDFFGPLMDDVCYEDHAIAFRSHLLGVVRYLDRELVSYRTHAGSITNFTKMENPSVLYASAAKRTAWMLVAIAQRKKDLDFAVGELPGFRRDYRFLSGELPKLEHFFKRRLKSYQQFPKLSFNTVIAAFRDIEIAKVVVRSFLSYTSKHLAISRKY
ncbi:MAG: glycosyltransferase [Polaromonas sp.]